MKKYLILTLLLLLMNSVQSQQFIQIGDGLQLKSLMELHELDVDKLDCSMNFLEVDKSIETWTEILESQEDIDSDIANLEEIEKSVTALKAQSHGKILLQKKKSLHKILAEMKDDSFDILSPYQAWRKEGVDTLQDQLNLLDQAKGVEDTKVCCDRIEKLIQRLLDERREIKRQCDQQSVTINIINDKSKRIAQQKEVCKGDGVTITTYGTADAQDDQSGKDQQKKPVQPVQPVKPAEQTGDKPGPAPKPYIPSVDKDTADRFVPISSNENKPVLEKEAKSTQDLVEYGYGFWARFFTGFPVRLPQGKDAQWYFVARLTKNANYGNIEMGDRLLAIWQGQGFYHFTTCDEKSKQPNLIKNINYPADIEGLWTYFYYSYSTEAKKAVAFAKYGAAEPVAAEISAENPLTKFVKLILGGKDQDRYPGFNGQITQVLFSAEKGVFIDTVEKLNNLNKRIGLPVDPKQPIRQGTVVEGVVTRQPETEEIKKEQPSNFVKEYSISGWFKWEKTEKQQEWHNLLRVTTSEPSTDKLLGDRTLGAWIGKGAGGILHLTTYTYTNMNGGGSPNTPQNIAHKERHTDWFFVYLGFSKNDKQVKAYVKWQEGEDELVFKDTNHYFANKYFIYAGKDKHFPGLNGQLAYVTFTQGDGAFKPTKGDLVDPQDIFSLNKGTSLKPVVKPTEPVKPTDKPVDKPADKPAEPRKPVDPVRVTYKDEEGKIHESAASVNAPKVDKVLDDDVDLAEYGYGFWARFLTKHPENLPSGKRDPWYFIARLTTNKEYDNIRMGDRILAIWQGQGFYHFTTCNLKDGNVNVIQNINYPADIEGLWTYVYYSFSVAQNKAVAFIKYGAADPQSVTFTVTHPASKLARFILGGKDNDRYPAFNGLFTQIVVSAAKGAFVDSLDAFKALGKDIPAISTKPSNKPLTDKVIERQTKDDPIQSVGSDVPLQSSYAISGWFLWFPTEQAPWHNVFRVQIKQPSTDAVLGDRTLSLWVGQQDGGILHFPTYTYTDMNGNGNPNLIQNIIHKNRISKWFFVYFGYDKQTSNAYAYVKWTEGEDSLNYEKVNHYLAPKLFVFLGKDNFFPGFNGKIAYVNFNTGDGAFKKGNDFTDPKDIFGAAAGQKELFKPKVADEKPAADETVHENKSTDDAPKQDKTTEAGAQNLEEYGYGFWLRFTTVFPARLLEGKNQPWYFVSRLTVNKEYDNIRMGDRTLAIWQGQGNYIFVTCNIENNNANVVNPQDTPADIEGVWTYVYYSYSVAERQAVGFIKFGNGDFKTTVQKVTNPLTKLVRFIVGGNDQKRYPGFNGVITSVYFNAKVGAYIANIDDLKKFLGEKKPVSGVPELISKPIVVDQVSREPADAPVQATVQEKRLPEEYAVSGWFKWKPIANQGDWHNLFRVQIKTPSTDALLGDRVLSCWVGKPEGGILHFPTYTYTNMNAAGNPNVFKNIPHKERHQQWFFVYFGYSKPKAQAHVYVKFTESEEALEYKDLNHYLAPEFFIFVGKDAQFPGLSGKLAYVTFSIGTGAHRDGKDFTHEKDAFGLDKGTKSLVKKDDASAKPVERPVDKAVLDSDSNKKEPVVDKEVLKEAPLDSYGYGFWLRFLTVFPQRLLQGKNQPWYFVARLTWNKEYDNARMGDRALAIWQGQGYYHLPTCNIADGNANVIQNIDYPEDIEGVWTYIYYSYSDDEDKAVAFIKYGAADPKTITHKVVHPAVKYVRFILGGTDAGRYPGFNGQFASVTFTTDHAYIGTLAEFNTHIGKVGTVSIAVKPLNAKLVEEAVQRAPEDDVTKYQVVGGADSKFATEYAISGWFRWRQVAQQPWHNLFRVQIKTPSTDSFLGDRTLSLWVGQADGGILHFPTYTYANMNGAGNANLIQNIKHNDRIREWFFVYYGYNKATANAYVFAKWTTGEDSLNYDKVNHYLAPEFYVFVGRDKQFVGHSGQIGYVSFNLGEGAFKKGIDFTHPEDNFGFTKGLENLVKKADVIAPGEADKGVLDNAFDKKAAAVDKEVTSEQFLEEYGYGFWFRFLTAYPSRLVSGKNAPWYFMARLTINKDYQDARMGDRTLALWQGAGFYYFTTCNTVSNKADQTLNNNFPEDIEGLWTYVYYSYSDAKQKAVGLIKYGAGDIQVVNHETTHPRSKYVRFVLGGTDNDRYPGFNGQFTSVSFSAQKGAFIGAPDQLKPFLDKLGSPEHDVNALKNYNLVENQQSRQVTDEPVYKAVGNGEFKFPHEYAFSGWFKWQPTAQQAWHNIFRVQIKTPSTDTLLGDRTLTCWLGDGILHFPTYTYTNMVGGGNANQIQNIEHKQRHLQWFFVYYGYSKKLNVAFIHVKWFDSEDQAEQKNTKHYFAPEFFVFVGRDKQFPGFNGKQAYANFNLGAGSYKNDKQYEHPDDVFGYKKGVDGLLNKKPVEFKPAEADKAQLSNAFNQEKPVVDKEGSSESALEEYGYGFWLRFLTVFPERLVNGKNEAWYFVARLTANKEYDNVRMSDRTLATWQGQGYYHFPTVNAVTNNANQIQNIDYPADIEGVWTYIYYSYSANANKAVAFIKYGDAALKSITHQTTHPITKYVRFILGGNDQKRYPGFNGIFTSVTFSTAPGTFVDSDKVLAEYIVANAAPLTLVKLNSNKLVQEPITRVIVDEPQFSKLGADNKFPLEYAISGWFKWTPAPQQAWHNIFRVQIKTPSTDAILGDRTLCLWLGQGFLHFPTYTYANMNGAGNTNLYQNIDHNNKHIQWFYVYYGYSKVAFKASVFVKWFDTDASLEYKEVNHYFVPQFFVFVGKDAQFPGFNGKIAYVTFNIGEGSFRPGKDVNHPDDIFGFKIGTDKLGAKPAFAPAEADKAIFENAFNQAKPVVDKEVTSEKPFEEYGYGFWMRFLTVYPQRLINGKNEAWYFVARLTQNKPYDNVGMGDRTLAIWQGQGYYHFPTVNSATNNANQIQNINYPDNIEGVWTYVYYSYSADVNKAVAFIKYGAADVQSITHQTTHAPTKYLRFILGGNDNTRYPGFNGIFTSVSFSNQLGAFVDDIKVITTFIAANPAPVVKPKQTTTSLISEPHTRLVAEDPLQKTVATESERFPFEYAISGWFKWSPVPQQAWHTIFRVQIKTPSTDATLGDRTLFLTLGQGIVQFATYTYANMNGAGNTNLIQNIPHGDKVSQWFYVYYGYSKTLSQTNIFVKWFDADIQFKQENVNHYFAPTFFIFVGKDAQFPGWNGKIAHVKFNAGDDSFRPAKDFAHPEDAFGYGAGIEMLKAAKPEFKPADAEKTLLENAFNQAKPVVDRELPSEKVYEQYGYGFWLRFLTVHPVRLVNGKNEAWYFVARLTSNQKYDNAGPGDRTLSTWQGQGYYHFPTTNQATGNNNQILNIDYPADIEGVWTYLYYSYSADANRAIAFIKYGNEDIKSAVHTTTHAPTKYLRFILGGNDAGRYPGFNGLFTQVTMTTVPGAFVDKADDVLAYIAKNPAPVAVPEALNVKLVEQPITREIPNDPLFKALGEANKFPLEYAISGWFKWTPAPQQAWHNIFRVQIKTPSTDAILGDRTLCLWLGQGFLHFPTYTYANMNGGGNTNLFQNIDHNNKHLQWFYVYYGYSKKAALASVFVKWFDSDNSLEYKTVNHYLVPQFFVYVGKDVQFPGFNGKIAFVNFNSGEGAFKQGKDYNHPTDQFGFKAGLENLFKVVAFKPSDANTGILENASTQKEPVIDVEKPADKPYTQYGYGFWMRFLTVYPQRLVNGKNEAWYFVARLTQNKPYDNAGMGDRTLAIWQGQGYYHFTTCNSATNNGNQIQNINYPTDIEGLWTYVYYSYNADANKAVAFIKYGDAPFQSIIHQTTHASTKYLRFILGGNDAGRYPGFNGLFTTVTFSNVEGAYVDSEKDILAYLTVNPAPAAKVALINTNFISDPITRSVADEPLFKAVGGENNKFPYEYAISGWYRWQPTAQQAWHNLFRVQIKQPSTDALLGDRTLCMWLGQGFLHFPTYTYSNMNGAGNTNWFQNIDHNNKHTSWFYAYYGYSKTLSLASVFIKWFDSDNSLEFKAANHYFAPQFFVYVGKDVQFPGHNGKIGYLNFNLGEGAFKQGKDYAHPLDVFGYTAGFEKLTKQTSTFGPGEANKALLESAFNQKDPTLTKEQTADKPFEEYGYGFWLRFLTTYPQRLLTGKDGPWYFVARLTMNKPYADAALGDRMLNVWQGQGYYHFPTMNGQTGNANQIQNINYADDIEGVWNYIYYSYSAEKVKAVVFLVNGDDIKTAVHQTSHPYTKYLNFVLGGNDAGRYPGFNGLFNGVVFSTSQGAFLDDVNVLKDYLSKNPAPVQVPALNNVNLIQEPITRGIEQDAIFKTTPADANKFPYEYAISGWYKWTPCNQGPWHSLFRVSNKQPQTDAQFLGDRTLTLWVNPGYLHFPTYTYVNMNGAGNVNQIVNIDHKGRHTQWFYVYYGYSKKLNLGWIHVKWTDGEDTAEQKNTKHYFSPAFHIYVGKDPFYPGHNGKIAYLNFNSGDGAFRNAKDYSHPNNVFGYKNGLDNLFKKPAFGPSDNNPLVLQNAFNQKEPVLDKELPSDAPYSEYGYGFWMRFLTVFPQRLLNGKNEAWYFVARLTQNPKYDNAGPGDRTLAIWQGQGYYHFPTVNVAPADNNKILNINYPEDIEGLWTYVYYSYSAENNKAVAFIKYGAAAIQSIVHLTTHTPTKYLRFILGGNDVGRYPGFNGLFASVSYTTIPGAFTDSADAILAYIEKNPAPVQAPALDTTVILTEPISRSTNEDPIFKTLNEAPEKRFPYEYAISGWYRWQPTAQQAWHNLFRVQIKTPFTDGPLGDRTLCMWLGQGFLHFPTYTYANMNGAGNGNLYQNIDHNNKHLQWFYVYYGYSKTLSKAAVYVKWFDAESTLAYDKVNHYFVPVFYVFVGKDPAYPGHNGKIGYLNFNIGTGAFRNEKNYEHEKDAFALKAGQENLLKKPVGFKPTDLSEALLENAFNQDKPVIDKEVKSDKAIEQYGYGFWFRFLTTYPQRLLTGKDGAWYFVARLTMNEKYADAGMGDRLLNIWQGQGYYHLPTTNAVTGNANQVQNVNYPEDIEGLWTYFYYSYSTEANKAVAFIKYGSAAIQTVTHQTTHPITKYLRFILGGNDAKRYLGFNGLFAKVTFTTVPGAYVDSDKDIETYLGLNPAPVKNVDLINTQLVQEPITRGIDQETLFKTVDNADARFPNEYAISGWYKWTPCNQGPWHSLFRVSNKQPQTDAQFLGDRTLTLWVNPGYLHFPTYTYVNMNGAGNANQIVNIDHKGRHTQWFYVYYGYSKKLNLGWIHVKWTDGEDTAEQKNTKHYFNPAFHIYVGKDPFYPGHNGKIAYLNFNSGDGAFRNAKDYSHPNNVFGYKNGLDNLFKKPAFGPSDNNPLVLQNAFNQKEPVLDKELPSDAPYSEYGYGFWMRFLTVFPQRLLNGKNEAWYFVARLTQNPKYDNAGPGDRTLAIWQGQGYYHFPTVNVAPADNNKILNINYPEDIEGLWTYVYYSYSAENNKAVAFIKYGAAAIQSIVHQTTHTPTKYLRFILGGNDVGRYPGFNGLFASVSYTTIPGAFTDSADAILAYIEKNPAPVQAPALDTTVILTEPISRSTNEDPIFKTLNEAPEKRFPYEYAISGWYRWQPTAQQAWHNLFRVQIKTPFTDGPLGDRTLCMWLGQGFLHFPTYTYANMNGAGNGNLYQNIDHNNKHLQWFYVYYGYSKTLSKAAVYVKWFDAESTLAYDKVNHYFVPVFYVFVGKDPAYPGHNGKIGYLNFNIGTGAFRNEKNYEHEKDAFALKAGQENLLKKPVGFKPSDPSEGLLENAFNQDKPVIDKEIKSEKAIEQYGYGFWFRFLTTYPQRLLTGKDGAWYFVARLTMNEKYADAGMGDRILCIWQGQGYYHFPTTNAVTGNANQIQNINYPEDIEGLWTYVYYSYSTEANKAIAYIKYGSAAIQTITHQTTHPITKYLRFVLGGNDAKRYPGFNGLFAKVTFTTVPGAYVDSDKDIETYVNLNPAPLKNIELLTTQLVQQPITRVLDNEFLLKTIEDVENRFPNEYAISGWYKWTPCNQGPWHSLFRVSNKQPQTDASYLGDRTLTLWVNPGYLHFPTYTYVNMNGAGNVNQIQNIDHKGRHLQWFYVYYGYSKIAKQALAYVKWTDGEDQILHENTRHYFSPRFFVYVGKDPFYPGHNGKVALVNFNMGEGAFRNTKKYDHPQDAFAYKAGLDSLFGVTPFGPGEADKTLFENAFNQAKPVFDKELTGDTAFPAYGYGFWMRFLTLHPARLLSGKNEAWYFVARLTQNPKYDNAGPGDRTLAIWQGQGYYHFPTVNVAPADNNKILNINFPEDIEGLWTYIYYSYSADANKAIAFIKYGGAAFQSAVHQTTHTPTKYVRLILGGNDAARYPGFNGQYTSVTFSNQAGAFSDSDKALITFLTTNPAPIGEPAAIFKRFMNDQVTRTIENEFMFETVGNEDKKFPLEYSMSGWYKWTPCNQGPWHNMWRVSNKLPATDAGYLGDRTLNLWMGNGYLHMPTYTYANMNGGGNVNFWQNINVNGKHTQWFFVYFGYSKVAKLAFANAKWFDSEDVLEYKATNHYLNPQFHLYVGKDPFYPGFSGKMAFVSFNSGAGIFRNNKDYAHPNNAFGYKNGIDTLFSKSVFKPNDDSDLLETSFEQAKPTMEKELPAEAFYPEYGFGFWLRFLSLYPARLPNGKNQPWYFIARLTPNQKYDNIGVGDRTLAIWQGATYYTFATVNVAPADNNKYGNIDFNEDIEGVWTFIYYSYSADANKAVAFLKYGAEGKIQSITHQVTHTATKYLRFMLGGNDAGRYPAVNGQFFGVTLTTQAGAFTDQLQAIQTYITANPFPVDKVESDIKRVWNEPVQRSPADAGVTIEKQGGDTKKFPQEYALSGWFKWAPSAYSNWNAMYRVSNKLPPGNFQTVGDQVLATFINANIFRFATSSYTNLNMGGPTDMFQDKPHNNRHFQWFFIYFGYNRQLRNAFAHLKFASSEETMEWKGVNHHLTPTFNLYVGKDNFYQGWSGKIAFPSWNTGAGIYRNNKDYAHPQDIFGYQIGLDSLIVKIPFKAADPSPLYENAHDQEKPVIDQELPSETPYGDYGYGFWLRWITYYPKILLQGKNQPNYFISRLTSNPKYANNNDVDRHLLILLSGNAYNFYATSKTQTFNTPDDIEGLWTYVYFSYSADDYQVPVFIKIGDQKLQTAVISQITLPATKYLRFIVGGNDQKRYPGLNGYFSKVRFTTKGAYTTALADIQALIDVDQPAWTLINKLAAAPLNAQVVQKRGINDAPILKTVLGTDEASRYPLEYAISGWFRWDTSPQQAWHTFYRVTIKNNPQTNANYPGDRTLCTWLGGGSYWFATYNVVNMQGAGNANQYATIAHGDKHTKWFFMYHGHDRVNKKQTVYMKWHNSDGVINWDNVNHYLTPQFYVYLGKDDHYPGINGGVGVVNFVYGPGAFRANKLFDQEEDLFAYKIGLASQTFFVQTENKTTQEEDKE